MEEMLIGVTDRTILVFIPDAAQTDGSGKTGLVAANMTAAFMRVETDNDVTITDATGSLNDLASLTAAHNDWGMFEVSNTLAPGWYRLDLADALFASGAWYAGLNFMITTSAASPSPKMWRLVGVDALDAVRMGMTALPNAAAAAAGGLWILGSNNTAAITIGALTTGAISATTIAASGTVTLSALTVSNNVLVSGTWTVTGASTFTGNVAYSNGVFVQGGSQVHALSLSAAAGGDGLRAAGNTTGSGFNGIGGTTGHGMKLFGGSTSGDGLNTAANGVGDGIEAVGTGGGADINADIAGTITTVTGNVNGNVGGSVGSVVSPVSTTSNIKINQALAGFEFLMTDSTTHAPQTGLVVTVTRSINGGAFAAGTLSAVTEIANGIYAVDFGAGDLNGKVITLQATAALADVTFERIVTQA